MDSITVEYSKFKKIAKVLKDGKYKDDDPINFEFIVGSLFPDIYKNIQERIKKAHAEGYIAGKQENSKFDD